MSMRKYERSIVRHQCIARDGNTKAFSEEWKKYHDAKVKARIEQVDKDGKVKTIRTKPITKRHHNDNGKLWLRQLRMMKEMFANMKKQAEQKKSEKLNETSE